MSLRNQCFRFLTLCFLLSLLLTGCTFTQKSAMDANQQFLSFTDELFRQEVSSSTLTLHYTLEHPDAYDIATSAVTYGSFQTDSTATLALLENYTSILASISYQDLSPENQLTYDVLQYYFDTVSQGTAFTLYEEPLSPVTGIHAQLPILLAEYALDSTEDIEEYLQLLEATPDYIDSIIAFERAKWKQGLFMSDQTATDVIAQCEAFLQMGESNYLLSTFEERLATISQLTQDQRTQFIHRNANLVTNQVCGAYQTLSDALTSLVNTRTTKQGQSSQGVCYLPNGQSYYTYLIRRDTGSSRQIDDLERLIQQQIASDMLSIQSLLTQYGDLTETTTTNASQSAQQILTELEEKTARQFPQPVEVQTQIKYVPEALEAYLSPAFYLIPTIDNTSENTIYLNGAHTLQGIDLFTTLAHEGYPGHLYQTTYYANTNPNPIRTILNFSGYTEGWATYAELCSYSLSSLSTPYASLLQANNSLILGLYASADIGIHYHGWSVEDTLQFFQSYGIDDEAVIADIYELIVGDPANYLKYYVGCLELLELKKETITEYSPKAFHQAILDIGPAPFSIIQAYLPQYLQ